MRAFVSFILLLYTIALVMVITIVYIFAQALSHRTIQPGWVRVVLAIVMLGASIPPYSWMLSPYST
jgi:hypothetical protein